jgi:hypothetical protein
LGSLTFFGFGWTAAGEHGRIMAVTASTLYLVARRHIDLHLVCSALCRRTVLPAV